MHKHPPRTSLPLPGLSLLTRCVWSLISTMCCSCRIGQITSQNKPAGLHWGKAAVHLQSLVLKIWIFPWLGLFCIYKQGKTLSSSYRVGKLSDSAPFSCPSFPFFTSKSQWGLSRFAAPVGSDTSITLQRRRSPLPLEGTLEWGWSRRSLFWHTLLINTKWWEWGMMLHWRS